MSGFHVAWKFLAMGAIKLGMWRSQPKSASIGCGFHVQNPSDVDADCCAIKISTSYYSYCDST